MGCRHASKARNCHPLYETSFETYSGLNVMAMLNKILKTIVFTLPIACCLLLNGCMKGYICVHTDYLSEESLASYYVNTPDPRRLCPDTGQRLIISWSVPQKLLYSEDLHLNIYLRYRNREIDQQVFAITQKSGTHMISTLNEAYYRTGGILTYKIELVGDGQVLEEWIHQIWANIIELKPLDPQQEPSETSDWDIKEEGTKG